MPMLIGVLVVIAAVYQLFFRYDTWSSEEKPDVRYEHDNLMGGTRVLKPDARVSVFARILGSGSSDGDRNERFLEPLDEGEVRADSNVDAIETIPLKNRESVTTITPVTPESTVSDPEKILENVDLRDSRQVAVIARPVPVPREVVIASSAPPVPLGNNAVPESGGNPFAVRQVDLDQDGSNEEIIQNAGQSDGLLDISIVKNGREIFFGRGKQISLLPTRNRGWADIALKAGGKTLQVFRYDVRSAAYKTIETNQG